MTAPTVRMVAVTRHHAAVIAALSERCLDDAWSDGAVTAILSTPGAFGFMAVRSGLPDAFILCRAAGGECEVLALGTVPGARRSGLGRCLVERAFAEAGARGATRMVLEVADDNAAARGLYARCGFAPVGCRPRYYRRRADRPADALILARDRCRID